MLIIKNIKKKKYIKIVLSHSYHNWFFIMSELHSLLGIYLKKKTYNVSTKTSKLADNNKFKISFKIKLY